MVTVKKVNFPSRQLTIAGDLYVPNQPHATPRNAAIVVAHPMTGVKEQTAGAHAKAFAENGFHSLAFDAAYQGESSGEPRYLEDPSQRVEDIRAAVTYLTTLEEVDSDRVGALGICASGGYVPNAAQTDVRIKAVMTVSAACTGRLNREGMLGTEQAITADQLNGGLKRAGELRTAEAKGERPTTDVILPTNPQEVPSNTTDLFREGTDYYRTARGQHARSVGSIAARSVDLLANYDSFIFNNLISPRPLLMIAGSKADTLYYSQDAIQAASEPKELFVVNGSTHVDLYDHTDVSMSKLIEFAQEHLLV